MPVRNAIVIVCDGWQAGMLGCYGNTWIKTPELDLLAAESLTFDQMCLERIGQDHRDHEDFCTAIWTGQSAFLRANSKLTTDHASPQLGLPEILRSRGIQSALLTQALSENDEQNLAHSPVAQHFTQKQVFYSPVRRLASDSDETQMAELLALAAEQVAELSQPFYFQIHLRGMKAPWDAPYKLRQQYADEEDPPPPGFFQVPARILSDDFDPDELLGIQQAYAGQVSLWDECLGAFLSLFRESPLAQNTLLIVTSSGGFPLGEHRVVGLAEAHPYSEWLHVPLLIRTPDGLRPAERTAALVQPVDLFPTLQEWFEIAPSEAKSDCNGNSLWPILRSETESVRDRAATIISPHLWSLRTDWWHLIQREDVADNGSQGRCELYVRPDDRFEVNEISNLCPEVVAGLKVALDDLRRNVTGAQSESAPTVLPPLPAVLQEIPS